MVHRKHQLQKKRSWSIAAWERFSSLSGWRKSAFINTVLVSAVLLVLISSHICLWARSGSMAGYHIIHSGSCVGDGVGRLNTLLHLAINILSTLVLASTNFFMQVLNAPSREELDNAHKNGSWLDIGVPSPRNAFRVSRFKTIMWLLFFLSSIPIHLLFNSSIYSTDYRRSEFTYFIFDESVLDGGAVFQPGASLSIPSTDFPPDEMYNYRNDNITWAYPEAVDSARKYYLGTLYPERSQSINATVEEITKGGWHRLDAKSCRSLYSPNSCSGLQAYRNVALILSGSSGWNRSQVWDLPASESSIWDDYIPVNVNNSLWLARRGSMSLAMWGIAGGHGNEIFCSSTWGTLVNYTSDPATWGYPLFADFDPGFAMTSVPPVPEIRNSRLSIEYCLVEPFETTCHIGLASNLLWVVSIWYDTHHSLSKTALFSLLT